MTRRPVRLARGALSGLFFFSYGLFCIPAGALLFFPVWPKSLVRRVVRLFFRLFCFMAKTTRLFRVECSAEDRERLRSIRGSVVVMNHVSLIDVVILMAHLGDSAGIAKAAAKRNFFLGSVVRNMFISNDAGAENAIEESRRCLGRGVNVVVFPEGTRVPPDAAAHHLNRGAARLALAASAPVEACHIEYDPPVLGKNQPWWDVGDRQILVKLSYRGTVPAIGENNYSNAVEITERIKEVIL